MQVSTAIASLSNMLSFKPLEDGVDAKTENKGTKIWNYILATLAYIYNVFMKNYKTGNQWLTFTNDGV